jgi:hypothetical protein
MMALSERPIFIVGVHRSGTTLLRYMLSSHPRIYIPPESDFIPRFFQRRPCRPMTRRQAIINLETIFNSYRLVREWQGDRPDPTTFVGGLPDLMPATFLDALYHEYAQQYGAERWGDKTPVYTSYMDLIDQIFPNAQFIHIIRDGRDVALSMVDQWGQREFHIDVYFAAKSWQRRLCQAFSSAQRLGSDRYYELRYERLAADPEPVLREICDFLGETYVPEMAKPHRLGSQRISPDGFHAAVRKPPSKKRVGRWRSDMSLADQRLVQTVAGNMLEQLGYEMVDLGEMAFSERARLATLKTKYAILQTGRHVLQAVGVFHPN